MKCNSSRMDENNFTSRDRNAGAQLHVGILGLLLVSGGMNPSF